MRNNYKMGVISFEKVNLILVIFLSFIACVYGSAGNEWGYLGKIGPTSWHVDYPVCGGRHQSPIDITTSNVILNTSLPEFTFTGFDTLDNVNMSIQNNGHTVEVDLRGKPLTISGGGLPEDYKVEQFHFHWGSKDSRGSEHLINGKHFPMEMHVVHYSSKYPDIKAAMNMTDGLAVLGFFFTVGKENVQLNHVINNFRKISHKDEHVTMDTFPLFALLPKNLKTYYRYYGSLTTPPCYESIIWTLFKTPIEVSENQLERFRNYIHGNILNQTDISLSDDFRPTQPLNGRSVYASDASAVDTSASHNVHKSTYWTLLCLLISMFVSIKCTMIK